MRSGLIKRAMLILFFFTIFFWNLPLGQCVETFLGLEKAKEKWGQQAFNAEKFKNGDAEVRSKMVVDLIQSRKYLGVTLQKVIDDLGKPDGYFTNDGIPAYLLSSKEEKNSEIWQVVFIPSPDWENVKEIKIHKNCCD